MTGRRCRRLLFVIFYLQFRSFPYCPPRFCLLFWPRDHRDSFVFCFRYSAVSHVVIKVPDESAAVTRSFSFEFLVIYLFFFIYIFFFFHFDCREVLERCIMLQLPAKKMKTLFQKFLEFESAHGSEERQTYVRQKALDYVESKTEPNEWLDRWFLGKQKWIGGVPMKKYTTFPLSISIGSDSFIGKWQFIWLDWYDFTICSGRFDSLIRFLLKSVSNEVPNGDGWRGRLIETHCLLCDPEIFISNLKIDCWNVKVAGPPGPYLNTPLLFHSFGVVILMFFYLMRNKGNVCMNVQCLGLGYITFS